MRFADAGCQIEEEERDVEESKEVRGWMSWEVRLQDTVGSLWGYWIRRKSNGIKLGCPSGREQRDVEPGCPIEEGREC